MLWEAQRQAPQTVKAYLKPRWSHRVSIKRFLIAGMQP
jgi:hypothetical protein